MSWMELSSDHSEQQEDSEPEKGTPTASAADGEGRLRPPGRPQGQSAGRVGGSNALPAGEGGEHPTAGEGLLVLSASSGLGSVLRGPVSSSPREVRGRH